MHNIEKERGYEVGITLKEALKIGGLKEGKVIAGEKGLNRIVSYVDILEVPDMLGWLRGEKLIVFYIFLCFWFTYCGMDGSKRTFWNFIRSW